MGLTTNSHTQAGSHQKSKTHCYRRQRFSSILHPMNPLASLSLKGSANGAIPVVIDSGAPREFVPSEWLFDSDDQAIQKIRTAMSLWNLDIAKAMQDISLEFSEQHFKDNMKVIFDRIVKAKNRQYASSNYRRLSHSIT